MAAYLIAQVDVQDGDKYARYRELVPATLEKFGGRYLARGGRVDALEGTPPASRLVIVEFPSMEHARAWWASEEYAPVRAVRHATATSNLTLVEGL